MRDAYRPSTTDWTESRVERLSLAVPWTFLAFSLKELCPNALLQIMSGPDAFPDRQCEVVRGR